MKIAYLSLSTVPTRTANSMHVTKMCQAFAQEGHDVTLVAQAARRSSSRNGADDLWDHYGIVQPFPVVAMRRARVLKLYDYNYRSLRLAQRMGADLIFSRNLGAAALAARSGLPTVLEYHMAVPDMARARREFDMAFSGPGFRYVVVVTKALKEYFLSEYPGRLSEDNVVVAPDGVDLERFESLPDPAEARIQYRLTSRFTVGYAGHLYRGRGIGTIRAIAAALPDVQFLVIGGNPPDVEEQIRTTERDGLDNIRFTGFVPNLELPQWLAACEVLLMPYRRRVVVHGGTIDTAKWCSPMKMFEYMAMRRLTISSDLPVLREVLNESNCVFCEPDNSRQWIEAVMDAKRDPERARDLAEQAYRDVQQYTWRKRVSRLLSGLACGQRAV